METHEWKAFPQHVRLVSFLIILSLYSLLFTFSPIPTLECMICENLQFCAFEPCPFMIQKRINWVPLI